MATILISKDTTLKCSECGYTATPEEMKADTSRMYKTRDGTLCECCYDDYEETYGDDD